MQEKKIIAVTCLKGFLFAFGYSASNSHLHVLAVGNALKTRIETLGVRWNHYPWLFPLQPLGEAVMGRGRRVPPADDPNEGFAGTESRLQHC